MGGLGLGLGLAVAVDGVVRGLLQRSFQGKIADDDSNLKLISTTHHDHHHSYLLSMKQSQCKNRRRNRPS
jgi:hypothetical protein